MVVAGAFGLAALAGLVGLKPAALFGFAAGIALLRARGLSVAVAAVLTTCAYGAAGAVLSRLSAAAGLPWQPFGPEDILLYPAAAVLGWLAGVGFAERWTYGRLLGVMVAPTGVLLVVSVLLRWQEWAALGEEAYAAQLRSVQQAGGATADHAVATVRALEWQVANWANISVGLAFAVMALGLAVSVAAAEWTLRLLHGYPGLSGRFRDFRPPDWLIWPVILLAVAAMADWHRPGLDYLRPVAWNGLIGLAAVYWLNGVSVIWHGLLTFKAHPLIIGAVAAFVVLLQMHPAVAMIGLFDTWYEFRRRFELLVRLRDARREANE